MTVDDFPAPPGSRAAARRPRATFTREQIVATGLRLLDAEGLAGVSMRRIAQELGTGPASLYAHVSGKDELHDAIADLIAGEVGPAPEDADWQAATKHYVREVRRVLVAHNDCAALFLGRIPLGPNALIVTEQMLSVMRRDDVPKQVAAFAIDILMLFAVSTAYEESTMIARFGSEERAYEYIEGVMAHFKALPAERFPTIATMVPELMTPDGMDGENDARFEFGLEMLVRGIADRAKE